ncbi:MAG: PAS domain S-box protein [Gemmatimonadetes bacterium]|nr:PAS domain S-box protein [Gemmatimonadota bacterium]
MALGLLVLGFGFRWRAADLRADALRRWETNLGVVADAAKLAVTKWAEERLADGRVVAAYAATVPELVSAAATPSGLSRSRAVERLQRHLAFIHEAYGYSTEWVVDDVGRVAVQLPGGPGLTSPEVALAIQVTRDGRPRFAEPFLHADSSVTLSLAVPVQGAAPHPLGAVVIRVDPTTSLFPLLQGRQRVGTTADVRILVRVGDDAALLNPVNGSGVRPLTLRTPWANVSAVSKLAIGGVETFGAFVNSAGVPILVATRHIEPTGWGLISRIEQSEAFAVYRDRLQTEMLLVVTLLGAFVLGFVAIARTARLAHWRDRIRTAAALEASEGRYRQLVESSLGLICTHDLNGVVLSLNPAAARALGLASPIAAVGRRLDEFVAPAVRPLFGDYLARIQGNGMDAGIMRVVTTAGEERTWEYRNTVVREPGREPYVLSHARDVTERQTAEEALRRSERSYRTLVERATYGIYRSTLDGRLLAVNPALVRMLGYDSEAELLDVDLARDVYQDPDQRRRLIETHGNAPYVEGIEADWKRKDGRPLRVRLSGTAVRNDTGAVEAFEMIVEDVTERHTLEAQLRQAQKMEAVGQLTGGIAHDFNNLLTVILANADLIAKSLPPEAAEWRADVEDLQGAARRGAAMVRKLLAFSRREELRLRPVHLPKVVADLTGMLRRLVPEHITLETRASESVAPVLVDPGTVEQILLNLVTNARDAMPSGGVLTITIAEAVIDETYLSSHGWGEPGAYVCLSVTDTGIGMDQATLAHVFEPFFTTKPPGIGTGLGMAMVYGLVKQQRGFVDVRSRPGEGTTVEVYLPVATRPARATPAGATADLPGGSETILLVEDEEAIRRSASRILRRFGYQVLLAADGEEALALYRRHRADIRLVISDVVMPRLGGTQLYQELHRDPDPPKFIFTSGYAARDVGDRVVLDRAGPLLQKPWNVDELLRRVREALEGR